MTELPVFNPVLGALIGLFAAASCITWSAILRRLLRGDPVLKFERRRPVPWGVVGPSLAIMLALIATWAALFGESEFPLEDATPLEMVERIGLAMFQTIVLTAIFIAMVWITSRPTERDFGLPRYMIQFLRDTRIGCLAWLAALIPVYGLQAALVTALDQESQHPLIRMVIDEPSPLLMIVAFVSAVVIAPISEEIAFRLLLQGWLEKVYGPRQAMKPILVSSAVFAIAHIGHGPDPIPIFVLALILGYVYRQTHRIIPCIVAHMLFNGLSMLALGLVIRDAAQL